jgi:hypothetical protein
MTSLMSTMAWIAKYIFKHRPPTGTMARIRKLNAILSGETPINLYLHFLYGHNRTDLNILKQIKDKLEVTRNCRENTLTNKPLSAKLTQPQVLPYPTYPANPANPTNPTSC